MGRNDTLQVIRSAIVSLQGKLSEVWEEGDFTKGNEYIESLKILRRFERELSENRR